MNLVLMFLSLSGLRDMQGKMSTKSNDHIIGYLNLEMKKKDIY